MKIKRFVTSLILFAFLFCLLPVTVSANSPPPRYWYTLSLSDLPEGTVYVDMLIPLKKTDENYVPLVRKNLPDGFAEDSQIVKYHQAGFCSYSFHYQNAASNIRVSQNSVEFFAGEGVLWSDHRDKIEELGVIRLAMLDKDGSILQVSSDLILKPTEVFSTLTGNFSYDAAADAFKADQVHSVINVVFYIFLAVVGMTFTVLLEYVVSIPFGIWRNNGTTVVLVNLISQILMHLLYVLLYGVLFWKYTYAVLLLELLVYAGEYLYYRHKLAEISRKKCLAYTLTANTLSLAMGIAVIAYLR